jgi:hypothetical protein
MELVFHPRIQRILTRTVSAFLVLVSSDMPARGVDSISYHPLAANDAVTQIWVLPAPLSSTRATAQLPFQWNSATELDSTATADEMSTRSETAATNQQDQPSGQQEKEQLNVNPVTGLAVASQSRYISLTGRERLKLYFEMNYLSVGAYFGPFFTALVLDQATGSPEQWGGGFPGYGRRVASRVGNAILQGSIQAPLAALLHEDVRYITSSDRGFKRRARHAIFYSLLTYNKEGHSTPNIANLSAYYASTAVSTAWLPGHYNVARYALVNGTEQVALSIPVNLLQEFWPEIARRAFRKH